jgi:hypothetical protein
MTPPEGSHYRCMLSDDLQRIKNAGTAFTTIHALKTAEDV